MCVCVCVAASPPGAERLIIHLASPLAVQEAIGKRAAAAKVEGAARIGNASRKVFAKVLKLQVMFCYVGEGF